MILNSLLPPELISLLQEIEELGFNLCLVGGAVRDYLSSNSLSHDLDFEIRSNSEISEKDWPQYYERLIVFFESKKFKVTKYPYLITKIDFSKWNLEFSSPRLEIFELAGEHSHHNFTAVLKSTLSFEQSFKRRDFTINAMGLAINCKNNSMQLLDPYNGGKHLEEKVLCNIDDDFFMDSVRLLRLIRFSVKYEMSIDSKLENSISRFNLTAISKYHFTSELFKTDPGNFLNRFRDIIGQHHLQLPQDFDVWKDKKFLWPSGVLKNKEDVLNYVYSVDSESAIKIQSFFSLPQKILRNLKKKGPGNDSN
jgi:tRNA nucleotidyltransferase (CCA-adding enzyme)